MRLATLCVAALLIACGKEPVTAPPATGVPAAAAASTPIDARVALLFEPSMARGPYDVDLSDVTSVLIQTLRTGDHESLRRAKMELAESGERGIDATRRFMERCRAEPGGSDYLRNAADVLSLSPEASAAPL